MSFQQLEAGKSVINIPKAPEGNKEMPGWLGKVFVDSDIQKAAAAAMEGRGFDQLSTDTHQIFLTFNSAFENWEITRDDLRILQAWLWRSTPEQITQTAQELREKNFHTSLWAAVFVAWLVALAVTGLWISWSMNKTNKAKEEFNKLIADSWSTFPSWVTMIQLNHACEQLKIPYENVVSKKITPEQAIQLNNKLIELYPRLSM